MATVDKSFRVKNGAVIEGSSGITAIPAATNDALIVTGRAGGSNSYTLTLVPTTLTSSKTATFQDLTGTVALSTNNLSFFSSTTSAQLAGVISDETGSGALVFATSPSLTTPSLGVATATSINKLTITAPTTSATLTILDGKTLTVNNTLTFSGTDASSIAFGTGGTVAYTSNNLGAFSATTSAQLAGIISDETGSGALVFATSPTLVTPNIGVATGTSFNSITGLSSTNPVMDGTAAVGTGTTVARADHVHPTDTSRAPINNPTFTGTVTLAADPVSALQAATKQYVDNAAAGLNAHAAVDAATTANLTATYSNGSSGVGATLTNSGSLAAFSVDGQSPALNARILVKNQSTQLQNGIYTLTTVGSGAIAWVLTRAEDQNTTPEMGAGDLVYVTAGTANATTLWVQTAKITTIGTDSVTWSQFSGASSTTAGAGLVQNGNAFDVATANSGRIVVNADSIDLATVSQTNTTGTAGINFVQSQTVDSYGRITGTVSADVRDATTSVKGIASFNTASFAVASGDVTIKTAGVSNTQLANSAITINSASTSLGGSVTLYAGTTALQTTSTAQALTGITSVTLGNGQVGSSTVTCPNAGTGYTLDTFATASFTSAKYIVQGTSGTERELTEFLVTVNAADVHIVEYGNVMTSGNNLFDITATFAAGTVTITVTPTTGNGGLVAKAMRTVIAA